MGFIRDCWRSSKGQSLVEFALIAPVILLMLAGIVDFGMAMNHRIVLQHAVREGARTAAVNDNISQVCDRIMAESHGTVVRGDITFAYEDLDNNGQYSAGDNVEVTLPYEWDLPILNNALFSLFNRNIGSVNLTARASARLERTVPGAGSCPGGSP